MANSNIRFIKKIYRKPLLIFFVLFLLNTLNIYCFWEPINAPTGGNILHLLTKDNNIFATAPGSGIYLSNDYGNNWNQISKGNDYLRLATYLEADSNYLYSSTFDKGVYRTSDLGLTWQKIHNGFAQPGKLMINRVIKINSNLFLCTKIGLFKSTDFGNNWDANPRFRDTNTIDLKDFNGRLYAGTSKGLFVSDDSGKNWTELMTFGEVYNVFEMNKRIYACVYDSTGKGGFVYNIFESSDDGGNWKAYEVNTFKNARILEQYELNTIASISLEKAIDSNLVSQVYISSNNGRNWNIVYENPTVYSYDLQSGLCLSNNYVFIAKRYNGIMRYNIDGTNRKDANNGIFNIQVTSLAFKDNIILAGTTENGIYFSDDYGTTWTSIATSPKANKEVFWYIRKIVVDASNIIAATSGGIFISQDDGLSWKELSLTDYYILDVAATPDKLFAVGNSTQVGHLFVSDNYGKSWSIKNIPGNPVAYSMYIDTTFILIGTSDGIFKTTNQGDTWVNTNPALTKDKSVMSIVRSKNSIVCGTYNGIYLSTDEGNTWVQSNTGLPTKIINSLNAIGRYIFCATDNEGYISTDRGTSWDNITKGLKNNNIFGFASNGNTVYSFLYGDAIYKSSISSLFGITIAELPFNVLCSDMEFNVDYTTDKLINFKSDNKFIAEISDPDGDFESNITIIGSISNTTSGSITVKIPNNMPFSTKYRIRVVSTNPQLISNDNLTDLSILKRNIPTITGNQRFCEGTSSGYNVNANPGFRYKWSVTKGIIIGDDTKSSITVNWTSSGLGKVSVVQENGASCTDSANLAITVLPKPLTPSITAKDSSLFSSSTTGNQWFLDGSMISDETGQKIVPKANGSYSVQVTNDEGCISDISAPYSFESIKELIQLIIDYASAAVGDIVSVNIKLIKNKDFAKLNIKTFTAVLVLDASVLFPLDIPQGVITNGKRFIPIDIDTNYITGNIIRSIRFRAMLGDAISSQMTFQNVKINDTDANVKVKPGVFTFNDICREGGARLIAGSGTASFISVTPNPASDQVKVSFQTIESGITKFYLVNNLGIKIKEFLKKELSNGQHDESFSVQGIPIGTYYLVMETQSQKLETWLIINR